MDHCRAAHWAAFFVGWRSGSHDATAAMAQKSTPAKTRKTAQLGLLYKNTVCDAASFPSEPRGSS